MIDYQSLKKIDSKEMHKTYDLWPKIARESFEIKQELYNFDKIEHIIFVGMGGSGTIGDIFASILSKSKIHVDVIKGYLLPSTVNSNTLVIVTSTSGNTIETLTVLKSAHKKKCKIHCFTSGGKIEKFCKKNNLKFNKIRIEHSPRASLPKFLYVMLRVLREIIVLNENEIEESINELEKMQKKISSKNLKNNNNPALNLAEWLPEIPLIYYPAGLEASAIRFKNSLQENTKIHVISEDVIEASHNGIVSWSKKSNVKPILIRGNDDFIKTQERWEVIKKFFQKSEIDYREVFSVNGNILSKLICLIYLFDYCSIYKAVLCKIDPTPVEPINYIKKEIN